MLHTVDDVFRYFEQFMNLERSPSNSAYMLDRMKNLVDMCNNPQQSFPSVHIAGSKGKGSTATMLANILSHCDRRIGLYTSPHLLSYRERICILDKSMSDDSVDAIIVEEGNNIQQIVEKNMSKDDLPTLFELLTLLAFCVFRSADCSYCVIETGLGGRLDATNVIIPELSIITTLELEHRQILGNTLAAIASEKAGIIKEGRPVLCAPHPPEAETVIDDVAEKCHAEVYKIAKHMQYSHHRASIAGSSCQVYLFDTEEGEQAEELQLRLIGEHQCLNAIMAIMTTHLLYSEYSLKKLVSYVADTYIPGRFEIVSLEPVIVYDIAHTPRSIENSLNMFQNLFLGKGILVFALAHDKEYETIITQLARYFFRAIITEPKLHHRFVGQDRFAALFHFEQCHTTYIRDSKQALQYAKKVCPEGPILVIGSTYLVAELMETCH